MIEGKDQNESFGTGFPVNEMEQGVCVMRKGKLSRHQPGIKPAGFRGADCDMVEQRVCGV